MTGAALSEDVARWGEFLGSIGHALVHHASCPVAWSVATARRQRQRREQMED
jgi:hypothetical protein